MDALKERIRDAIWNAGMRQEFVTATAMVREFHPESADPIRTIKKKIEELRNEENPIVGLPGRTATDEHGRTQTDTDNRMGPGYTWVHDPGAEWGRAVIGRFDLDIGSRIREMVRHRAVLTRMTVVEAQTELFGRGTGSDGLVGAGVSDEGRGKRRRGRKGPR